MNIQANCATSYFDYKDDSIRVSASFLSGKEQVFVNEILVSETRNLRYRSEHPITVGGQPGTIKIHIKSVLKGPIVIEFWVNGQLVDSDEWDYKRIRAQQKAVHAQTPWWKHMLVYFLSGAAGVAFGYTLAQFFKG